MEINPIGIILIIVLPFIIYLILRWFNCWYWKINKRVELLLSIYSKLYDIDEKLKYIKDNTFDIKTDTDVRNVVEECKDLLNTNSKN